MVGSRLASLDHIIRSSPVARHDEAPDHAGAAAAPLAQLAAAARAYRPPAIQRRAANRTGLPDALKASAEARSGVSLDDVKVHYNSAKPSQLQAHAYAQGANIHIGPGQTRHLAHELWHVVQQKRSQIKPTTVVNGVAVNDDKYLEADADQMARHLETPPKLSAPMGHTANPHQRVVQRDETDGKSDTKDGVTSKDIEKGVKELEKRRNDMLLDKGRQFHAYRSNTRVHRTTWPGHVFQFFFKQALFQRTLNRFRAAGGVLGTLLAMQANWAAKLKPPVSPGGHTFTKEAIAENAKQKRRAQAKASGKK